MPTIAMSGSDSLIINNRIISDLSTGDVAVLTFPNEIATIKTGKNGNSIYGLNETGRQAELVFKVIRGSPDDRFLNNLLAQQQNNFAGFPLMTGEFTKQLGNGAGVIIKDTYILGGGIFFRLNEARTNVEGDPEQSETSYSVRFSNAPRVLG